MIDGVIGRPSEASVSVFDSSVLFGDAYFESLRTYNGNPVLLDAHLLRLAEAVIDAGYANPPDESLLRAEVLRAIDETELDECLIRVSVTGGTRRALLAERPRAATRIIWCLPLSDAAREGGDRPIVASLVDLPGYAFPRKSANFQTAVRLTDRARGRGIDEVIIRDKDRVIEGLTSNVFAALGDELVTPLLGRCLPGVTRGAILGIAARCGLRPVERELSKGDLFNSDAVYVANSLIELRRVVELDGREIASLPEQHATLLAALRAHYLGTSA